MDKNDVDQLVNRWVNEPDFRKKMRRDPVATLKSAGYQLDQTDINALGEMDWNLPDDELKARVNLM